jgi:large subunit ribosomal protein L23Ae
MDASKVLIHPLNTESAMKKVYETLRMLEEAWRLTLRHRSRRTTPAAALKKEYDVNCVKINTLIRPDGTKKAFARLTADVDALDIAATKLNLV